MPTIKTGDNTEIYYKDWGTGQPVVFNHGWPLSADAWEDQMQFLASHGYRLSRTIAAAMAVRVNLGAAMRWTLTPPTSRRWSKSSI
jgi:pimeloyl-ACP methyl ester carboxylesterase